MHVFIKKKFLFLATVPMDALEVSVQSDGSSPVLGQSYTMSCLGHKTTSGLSSLPFPQWLTLNGNPLTTSSGVQVQGPMNVGLSSTSVTAQFTTLRTSNAGNYTCRVSLSSPALSTPLVKVTYFAVIVQSK